MTTVTDVTTQAASGLNHIDALLDQGPGWNWLAPARSTLLYTFSLASGNASDAGSIYSGTTAAFNATQQAAAVQAMTRLTQITGIQFQATSDGSAADIHFSNANLVGNTTSGYATTHWSYSYDGQKVVTAYSADAYVYLDNVQFLSSNSSPTAGSTGYEVLLHELGHALGLKHPFEGAVQLPAAQDDTAHSLMSYTDQGGPYSDYAPYDVAALMFLYGGDGLGGALGVGSQGLYLVGTTAIDSLAGGSGNDRFDGGQGNDTISGGGGIDSAVYGRARADYQALHSANGTLTVQALAGNDGRDTLSSVERLIFSDQKLAFDLNGNAGITARDLGAVFGKAAVANKAYAGIGIGLLDSGTTPAALMQLALDSRLGPGFGAAALVDLLYTNLVGQAPSPADKAFWVGTLSSGQYTPLTLAQMAADLDLNLQNIDLVGLAANGLGYT